MRWKLIFPAAALFVALTGTAAHAATDGSSTNTPAADNNAATADPSLAAAAAGAASPYDWGPPPKGGARDCELWVDPPAGVQVTVSNVTFNGDPSTFTDTRTYDVSPGGPGEVVFPLDSSTVPHGDVQVAFTASWELSTQTSRFSGTVHCSDPTPPPAPPAPPAPPSPGVPTQVAGLTVQRAAAEPATSGNTLPFTGADHTLVLVLAGVALVGLGAVAVSRGRRTFI
jgi:LPXTG-motif cell wall-anchored protein